jgi:hypothetical protein
MTYAVHRFALFKDGNAWCAVGPGFIDIMASPCGFGLGQADAVREFQKRWYGYRDYNKRDLEVADFVVCDGNPRSTGQATTA